jgi:hypothetical protein
VFTSSNAAAGNVVIALARGADGVLKRAGEFPTGGNGIGGGVDPLQSQNSIVLADDHQRLYVVNAGSNSSSSSRDDPTLRRSDLRDHCGCSPAVAEAAVRTQFR